MQTLRFPTIADRQAWAKACDKVGWQSSFPHHTEPTVRVRGLQPEHIEDAKQYGGEIVL